MGSPALPAAPRALPMPTDKTKRCFLKTLRLRRGEKRIAGSGEGSVGGPDEIKRSDRRREIVHRDR